MKSKLLKKALVLFVLCLVTLSSLSICSIAADYNSYSNDKNIVGEYKPGTSWSEWSDWTFNKLETRTPNKKQFQGPYAIEIEIGTRSCWIRKNGKVDTIFNPFVFITGGYRSNAKVTQYKFRVRILYWVNSKALPTGLALLNIPESKANLYNELFILRTFRGLQSGFEWAREELKGYLIGEVIGFIPGTVGTIISYTYNVYDIAQKLKTIDKIRSN